MNKLKKESILILVLVIILGVVSFLIIKDFIIPIIFTGVIVYSFHPIYKKIMKYLNSHILTSMLSIFLILAIIIVPISITVLELSQEFSSLNNEDISNSLNSTSQYINGKYNSNINLNNNYNEVIHKINTYISQTIYTGIPKFVFNVFIISFFFYYFLKNYENENFYFKILFDRKKIYEWNLKIRKLLNGIIYGQIAVRFIQAAIGTTLLLMIGTDNALIWGTLMFFSSFLPIIGTGVVWVPLILLNFLKGEINTGIIIFIIGIIVSSVDNLLLPYMISDKTNIGPVVTLISILGGLQLFGIYGIVLGPFFLGVFFATLEELVIRVRHDYPIVKRYIWTEEERKIYKTLKTNQARDEYLRMLQQQYETQEKKNQKSKDSNNNKVKFRYVAQMPEE